MAFSRRIAVADAEEAGAVEAEAVNAEAVNAVDEEAVDEEAEAGVADEEADEEADAAADAIAFLSFIALCKLRLEAVLYDFSFTNTFVSVAGGRSLAGGCGGGGGGGLFRRSFALLYSFLISTWISLGAFVSIIYFLEIVSKYL